jgi:oxygen-dependent protoporphyrinogen oxidase
VVHLGFRTDTLGTPPDGFGFLVPRGQGPRILGALIPSNTFDGRAPDSSLLMTIMIGGAQDPQAVQLPDDKLLQIVRNDLKNILDVHAGPSISRIVRWERGIPQYVIGHRDRQRAITDRLGAFPGLWIAGNSIGGVSINDCVKAACETAGELSHYLTNTARD